MRVRQSENSKVVVIVILFNPFRPNLSSQTPVYIIHTLREEEFGLGQRYE
jgi:hypothetical protein